MPLLGSLKNLLRPLLGMSQNPRRNKDFPDHSISVEHWKDDVLDFYASGDVDLGPAQRTRMPNVLIKEFRRYKEPDGAEHEYLVAQVDDPGSTERYLRIERTITDRISPSPSSNNLFRTASNSSIQSSLLSVKSLPAQDSVTPITGWPTTGPSNDFDFCIEQVDCSKVSVRLLDLALIANVVHNNSHKYRVFRRQCYWYADTISAVLQTSFPGTILRSCSPAVAAHRAEDAVDEIYDSKSGTHSLIRIHKRRQTLVNEVTQAFRQSQAEAKASIMYAADRVERMKGAENRAEEAERKVEEALRMAEAERQDKERKVEKALRMAEAERQDKERKVEKALRMAEAERHEKERKVEEVLEMAREEKEAERKEKEKERKEKERQMKQNEILMQRIQELEARNAQISLT